MNIVKKITCILVLALSGLLAAPCGAGGITNEECQGCHSDKNLKRESGPASGTSLTVPDDALAGTPHEGFGCVDCHAGIKEIPHPAKLDSPACGTCHPQVEEEMKKCIHTVARAKGISDAPVCHDCHGVHKIKRKADEDSPTNPRNVAATCAKCHANPDISQRNHFNIQDPLKDYQQSVHYKAVLGGGGAATCAECHGHHYIGKSSDPESNTFKSRIPKTCGRCHKEIFKAFEESVHGQALARGVLDSPSCVDCHGEHATKGKKDPTSSVYPQNIARTTCPRCHADTKIMSRYGIESGRFSSYENTYHGLAVKGGSAVAANCASCHGIHDILPSSNPKSAVHPAHLPQTCGKCHPKATETFTKISVHSGVKPPQDFGDWLAEIIRYVYIILIVCTIGGMAAHNGIILFFYLRKKMQHRRGSILHTRFSFYEVGQHYVMIAAFTILVVTGFALKFPESFWVAPLSWLGLTESIRRIVHRVAGFFMLLQAIVHGFWLVLTSRGRGEIRALFPWFSDLRDFFFNMGFHLGLTTSHPKFDRYSYMEKAEYLALMWGTIVMVVTGLMLWFPTLFAAFLPAWALRIAEIIHYFEAWLATLSILVWHMFFTHLHPNEYPFSATLLDGKVTEEEMKENHPLEFQNLQGGEDPKKPA